MSDAKTELPGERNPLAYAHYRVLKRSTGLPWMLGSGGMGITYKAVDTRLKIEVALKVIHPARLSDPKVERLFVREARSAARVLHPNVAPVLFLSDSPGRFFYAMEFVDGVSLGSWLSKHGPLQPRLALGLAAQVARGLQAIHEQQIIHRDLKPTNVMVVQFPPEHSRYRALAETDGCQLKIIDFGLAKVTSQMDLSASMDVTSTAGFHGTILYASPEQCEERRDLDVRSDLYSLGCILWEMLLGHPPFRGTTLRELLNQHATEPVPLQRVEHLPAPVREVLTRLLAKRREDRYIDAETTAAALEATRMHLTERPPPRPRAPGLPGTVSRVTAPVIPSPDSSPTGGTTFTWRAAHATASTAARATARATATQPRLASRRWWGAGLGLVLVLAAAGVFASRSGLLSDRRAAPVAPVKVSPKSLAVLPFASIGEGETKDYFAEGIHEDILTTLAKIRDLTVISRTSVLNYKPGVPRNLRTIAAELGVAKLLEGTVRRAGNRVRVTAQLVDAATDRQIWAEIFDGDLSDIFAIQGRIAREIGRALAAKLTPQEEVRLAEKPTLNAKAYDSYLAGRAVLYRGLETNAGIGSERRRDLIAEAIVCYERALEADPKFALAYAALANLHGELYWYGLDRTPARAAKVRETALAALRVDPESAEPHLAYGEYLYRVERNFAAALAEFETARNRAPGSADANVGAMLSLRRLDRWPEAVEAGNRALELGPRDLFVLATVTEVFEGVRDWKKAVELPQRAARLARDPAEQLALAARNRFHGDGDLAAYRTAMQPLVDRIPRTERVDYLRVTGEHEAGLENLRQLPGGTLPLSLVALPKTLPVGWHLRWLGRESEAQASFALAAQALTAAVNEQPESPHEHAHLAWAFAGLGQQEEAVREARRAMDLLPESRDAIAGRNLQAMAAFVFSQFGLNDEALKLLEGVARRPNLTITRGGLMHDPAWGKLRGEPRFQAVIVELDCKVL